MNPNNVFVAIALSICLNFLAVDNVSGYAPREPLVKVKNGYVRGSRHLSRNSREFNAFQGIPYAKPPVGKLRFKNPEPPEKWSFPVDARKDGPFCIQKNYFFANPTTEGQEDCLYLNIYAPNKENGSSPLPVMVFIHWGGFFAGRGTSDYLGPDYFMDKDVILVTFNYRLGIFGFLSTLDDEAPGNLGLKDQTLALKFVKENIEAFGGDPNRVTIFGQSAGSGSVSLHMISPSSQGLFQQAICQSGVALDLWAKPLNPLVPSILQLQATFVGCSPFIGNSTGLIDCLQKVNATELVDSGDNFKYFSIEPLTAYNPVTETKSAANPEPFLTKEPLEYLQADEFQKVPWIVGAAHDEGILRVSPLLRQPDTRQKLNEEGETLLPKLLGLELSVGPNTTSLLQNVTDYYLGGKTSINISNPDSVQGFINLYSDRAFVYGTYQTVILQSLKRHKPIWMYNFDYRGEYSYGDKFAATTEDIDFKWGVSHCDDLLYLFTSPGLFPPLTNKRDVEMSIALIELWTTFATSGNPDPTQEYKWSSLNFSDTSEIKNDNLAFLNITGHFNDAPIEYKVEKGYFKERMKFWADQSLAENFPGLN